MAGLLTVLVTGGCAVVHAPVPVEVGPGVRATMAGVWQGSYESAETGRVGSLTFALSADADSAVGEVVMSRRGVIVDVQSQGDAWRWRGAERPQILTIRFVRLGRGSVVGELDPYTDPDCGCRLRTTFQGTVDGDSVEGTFRSSAEHAAHDAEGTWRATRRAE